nr:hypothetical protein Q903MT_gene1280 [Picea sitchensis]
MVPWDRIFPPRFTLPRSILARRLCTIVCNACRRGHYSIGISLSNAYSVVLAGIELSPCLQADDSAAHLI